jgi:hypothetical protein
MKKRTGKTTKKAKGAAAPAKQKPSITKVAGTESLKALQQQYGH